MTTVSIGILGEIDQGDLAAMEKRLEEWLVRKAPQYQRAGNLRVMGYNSPNIKSELRYYEVELPIEKK